MIETLDDIVRDLANKLGVYGAHDERLCSEQKPCRVCFESILSERINSAVKRDEIFHRIDSLLARIKE